jgi:serine/threonine-protein kinase
MIMELIQGETLRDLRLRTTIALPQALDYIAQTLSALTYAHRLGVVHRDIKPSNIMIAEGGLVKLLDFGIALTEHGSQLTRAGFLLGSLNYMSPEQMGGSKANVRSDIYAVGVTLYELLTGTLPIKGASNYEIMMGHINQTPQPPHQIASHIPIGVSSAVMRALAKDPAQRFATAEEFLYALRLTLAAGEPGMTYASPLPVSSYSSSRTPAPATPGFPFPTPVAAKAESSSPASVAVSNTPLPMPPPTSSTEVATQPIQSKSGSASGLQNLSLEDISRKLAVFIGPVARIVVKKLAAQSEDVDFIFHQAARHISSDADRAAFLKSRRR